MKLSRRRFVRLAAAAATLPAASPVAWAQAYPTRSVRVMVGFPAGGTGDILARLIGQWLSECLGQPFVIENRPSAGAVLATEGVVRAPADGYTLLLATSINAINASLQDRLNYNFIRDIAPVAGVARTPLVLEVHPSLQCATVPELIAYAKGNPGKINMASFGTGTLSHLSGELFKMMTGVEMLHVPYRGSAPMLIDLLSGEVQLAFDNLPASLQHIRSGKLRPLAVTTATRSDTLPDIPALHEIVAGFEASGRRWRTEEYARQDRRQAQQGNQRRSRRPQDEGAACRPWRHGSARNTRELRHAGCRRNREMGQGDPRGEHQGGVNRPAGSRSRLPSPTDV